MLKKTRINLNFIHKKSIIIFLSFFTLQVNAETQITAKDGDTLFKLSKQYGVSLRELMHKNNFNDANKIVEGEIIVIPKKNKDKMNKAPIYKIKEGDTLYKISREYDIKIKDIISINNIDNASFLKPNQIIKLPIGAVSKKVFTRKNIQLARKKVSYHQTSKVEKIIDIANIHSVSKEEILSLNKIKNQIEIKPYIKLKIRKSEAEKWEKYGSLIINWADWRYQDGNYITEAKNKKNKSFYIAISCEKRVLNNSYWTKWYFPKSDFEFKLINDFCDQSFKI